MPAGLLDGTAVERPQDLSQGGYFGGRRPEDGRIPSDANARQVHDLVRALAPPYPGAFLTFKGQRVLIERTLHAAAPPEAPGRGLRLWTDGQTLWLMAADGSALRVLSARRDGDAKPFGAHDFETLFSARWLEADA